MKTTSFVLLCAALLAASCDRRGNAPPPPQAPVVSVAHPVQREVQDWDEYAGRLTAIDAVDLRARVSGYLERAPFNEGAIVEKDALLFQLDAAPFEAELNQAKAEELRAQGQQEFAKNEFERISGLRTQGAASEVEFSNARLALAQANAAVAAARAAVTAADLNVRYTRVTAPIRGRVGAKLVTPGNLVTGGAVGTLLTTIATLDPIYVVIDVDEQTVRKYQRLVAEGRRVSARDGKMRADMRLVDEPEFTHEGHIDFVDNRVDPMTGTIRARGVFANPGGTMLPGFFARMRIPAAEPYPALLVPDVAIGTSQAQKYVLVVDASDTVVYRPVTLGRVVEGLRVVRGIAETDRVIVNGIMFARPGAKVRPQPVTITTRPADAKTQAQTRPTTAPTTRIAQRGERP